MSKLFILAIVLFFVEYSEVWSKFIFNRMTTGWKYNFVVLKVKICGTNKLPICFTVNVAVITGNSIRKCRILLSLFFKNELAITADSYSDIK